MTTTRAHRGQGQTRRTLRFPLRPVALGCATVMLGGAGAAMAQSAPQTVTVTGIRAAIESAISVKKNADTIVEAISAEDIGKLPDASVAESISRLPGVAMQRSSVTGKAQEISVRGMSPDFNGGTLNGREQASTGTSRGVQFDQFPAELVTGVTIHKTADASLMNQGLSSTINMLTARPLDFSGRNVVVAVRGEKAGKAENKPGFRSGDGLRTTLSYIDQFDDRKLGIALGYTHSKAKGSTQPDMGTWGGWTTDTNFGGGTVKTPGGFTSRVNNTDETRDAVIATLQYKPHKDFETTVDVMWSKGSFNLTRLGLEGPVGGLSAGANDPGGTLIAATVDANGVATSGTFDNFKGVINNHLNDYTDELKSFGWNLKGRMGDWKLEGDLSHSENVRRLKRFETTLGLAGDAYNTADTISYTGFDGTNHTQVQYSTGLNYADPNIIKLTDVQGWAGATGVQDGYYAEPVTKDKVQSLRFAAQRDVELGWVSRMTGGLNFTERTKDHVTREGALVINGALDANGNVVNRLIAADVPNGYQGFGGTTGIPTLQWDPTGSLGPIYALDTWTQPGILAKNWGVKEKVTTAYVRGDIDAEVGQVPLRGNVGLQLVRTQSHSTGFVVQADNCPTAITCNYTNASSGQNYTDVLPSVNLAADIGKGQVLRFGLGKVLSRPAMEDMRAGLETSYDPNFGRWTGTSGNPQLKPFKSTNLDLSYEKYFGNKGYVSVAGFYKDLDTYILKVSQPADFTGLVNTNSNALTATDSLTRPINGSGGHISGIEVAVNIPLSMLTPALDGFGVMVNHSDTNSSIDLTTAGFSTVNIGTTTIPLPGLSRRVTNLRAYYEKGGLQLGVAARQRSPFLGVISDYQDNNQLAFIKGETTIDVQLGYEFSAGPAKGLTLLLQGTNVTNAPYVEFNPSNGAETVSKKFGSVWSLGANYKF